MAGASSKADASSSGWSSDAAASGVTVAPGRASRVSWRVSRLTIPSATRCWCKRRHLLIRRPRRGQVDVDRGPAGPVGAHEELLVAAQPPSPHRAAGVPRVPRRLRASVPSALATPRVHQVYDLPWTTPEIRPRQSLRPTLPGPILHRDGVYSPGLSSVS